MVTPYALHPECVERLCGIDSERAFAHLKFIRSAPCFDLESEVYSQIYYFTMNEVYV